LTSLQHSGPCTQRSASRNHDQGNNGSTRLALRVHSCSPWAAGLLANSNNK
jgi:hypothetical protein